MAIRYAVGAGNFSANATWDGGASIPASGDYVYANGFAVVLDTDVNIGSGTFSTEVCPTTGVGGGRFEFTTNRIIVGNIIAGASDCVYSTAVSNITSTLYVVGNVDGVSSSVCGISQTISSTKTSTVEIVGNISKYAVRFVRQSNNCRVSFSLTGNANTTGGYCLVTSINSASITYVVVNINGIVTGNAYEFADPAASTSAGFSQLGTYTVVGGVVAETALRVLSCATAIVTGYVENFGGKNAVDVGSSFQLSPTYYKIQDADGNDLILYPSTTLENTPAPADVREGVIYGIGNTYEGTLIIPPVDSVVKNVPVDDTVGTYELTPEVIEHITELKNPKKVLGSGIIAY